MIYQPEAPFKVTGNLVYNLRQTGWSKGEAVLENDVAISIQGNHLSNEVKKEIADAICKTLNDKYFVMNVNLL